jgi:hypothetical protein
VDTVSSTHCTGYKRLKIEIFKEAQPLAYCKPKKTIEKYGGTGRFVFPSALAFWIGNNWCDWELVKITKE